jgi:hypothetical protein
MTDPEDRTPPPNGEPPVTGSDVPPPPPAATPEPVSAVEPSPGAEVEPAPTADVEPAPPVDIEPTPASEVEPAPSRDVDPVTVPTPPITPARARKQVDDDDAVADEREDDLDDLEDLEPIPRWVGLVNALGVGLVVVMGAWVVAAVIQGLYYPANEGQGITNDLLHRLGTAFVPTHWVLAMIVLIVAVVLMSLPVLLEEDVTYGQERAASIALIFVVVIAIITCLGAVLAVRASLHAITAQGQTVPTFYRVDRTAYLLAVLGTGILAVYAAVVARGMRYGNE